MGAGAGVGAGICLELEPEPEILKMGGSVVNPAMKLTVSACPEDWKYCTYIRFISKNHIQ